MARAQDRRVPRPARGGPRLTVSQYHERRDAHRYAHLAFVAPTDDEGVVAYEVRCSDEPITDVASILRPRERGEHGGRGAPAPRERGPGETIEVDLGGLLFERHDWFAERAIDACNRASEIAVTEHTTPAIQSTTMSPCFVATAARGTPMAEEIGALRRFRDGHLRTNIVGEALVDAYDSVGPDLAARILSRALRRITSAFAMSAKSRSAAPARPAECRGRDACA